eukprot:5889616-Pyramimonas_sp.AAC.2
MAPTRGGVAWLASGLPTIRRKTIVDLEHGNTMVSFGRLHWWGVGRLAVRWPGLLRPQWVTFETAPWLKQ